MSEIHDRPGVRTELAYMASGQLSDVLELLKGWADENGEGAVLSLAVRASDLADALLFALSSGHEDLGGLFRTIRGRAPTQGDCAWLEQRALDRGARHG